MHILYNCYLSDIVICFLMISALVYSFPVESVELHRITKM